MSFILGLTGGIGSGKSAASQWFESKNIVVVDADIVAREVVMPGLVVFRLGNGCFFGSGFFRFCRNILVINSIKSVGAALRKVVVLVKQFFFLFGGVYFQRCGVKISYLAE